MWGFMGLLEKGVHLGCELVGLVKHDEVERVINADNFFVWQGGIVLLVKLAGSRLRRAGQGIPGMDYRHWRFYFMQLRADVRRHVLIHGAGHDGFVGRNRPSGCLLASVRGFDERVHEGGFTFCVVVLRLSEGAVAHGGSLGCRGGGIFHAEQRAEKREKKNKKKNKPQINVADYQHAWRL